MTTPGPVLFSRIPIDLRDAIYRSVKYMAEYGFHAQTIADKVGISKGQIYSACGKLGLRLRDYRDGKNDTAKGIIRRAPKGRG